MSGRRQDPLGRRLREMYDNVSREEIPQDFLDFLRAADEREGGGSTGGPKADDDPDEDGGRDDPLGVKPLPRGPTSGPRMDAAAAKPERDLPFRLVARPRERDHPA